MKCASVSKRLAPQSRVWVGTFHGFCARMLRKYSPLVGIDTGFSIYDQADRLRVVKSMMEVMGWDGGEGWTPERVESAISRAKNELVSPAALKYRARDNRKETGRRGLRALRRIA